MPHRYALHRRSGQLPRFHIQQPEVNSVSAEAGREIAFRFDECLEGIERIRDPDGDVDAAERVKPRDRRRSKGTAERRNERDAFQESPAGKHGKCSLPFHLCGGPESSDLLPSQALRIKNLKTVVHTTLL